jgi:hypothetical protein
VKPAINKEQEVRERGEMSREESLHTFMSHLCRASQRAARRWLLGRCDLPSTTPRRDKQSGRPGSWLFRTDGVACKPPLQHKTGRRRTKARRDMENQREGKEGLTRQHPPDREWKAGTWMALLSYSCYSSYSRQTSCSIHRWGDHVTWGRFCPDEGR